MHRIVEGSGWHDYLVHMDSLIPALYLRSSGGQFEDLTRLMVVEVKCGTRLQVVGGTNSSTGYTVSIVSIRGVGPTSSLLRLSVLI